MQISVQPFELISHFEQFALHQCGQNSHAAVCVSGKIQQPVDLDLEGSQVGVLFQKALSFG